MEHKTHIRRFLSTLLALCMVISMFSGLTLIAGAEGELWQRVELADVAADDVVVVVATLADGSTVALPHTNGTTAAPGAEAITVEDGAITSQVSDDIKWNIASDGESFTFYPNGTTDTWLYCTNGNNGVRVGTNANKAFTLDAATGYLKNVATNRYLGVYSSQDWRCYQNTTGNTKDQTFAFYKLTTGGDESGFKVTVKYDSAAGKVTTENALTGLATGATVTLTAEPNPGYEFLGWEVTGATVEDEMANPITITVGTANITATALFVSKTYTVTVNPSEGGTVTADPCENVATNTAVTVMAEAQTGYTLASWSYTTQEDSTTVELGGVADGITSFNMPADNVTINATFTAVETYQVDFAVGGNVVQECYVQAGKALGADFPADPTAPEGYAFVGWTTADRVRADGTDGDGNPIPYFYADTPVTEEYMIVQAVFARTEQGSGSGNYIKVTENLDDWSGEYAIVFEESDSGSGKILDGSLTKVDVANNYQAVEISENTIEAAQADPYNVTIAPTETGFSIQTKSGFYIGQTSDANGLGTSEDTAYNNTISITNNSADIVSSGGAHLRYNSAENQCRFRYYKSTSYSNQNSIQLYKKDGGATVYTDYTLEPEAVVNPDYEEAIKSECIVVLNYDRNVNIDIVDYELLNSLGGATVTKMELSGDEVTWSDVLPLDDIGAANAYVWSEFGDGVNPYILLEPGRINEADYTFFCRVTLSNGATYTCEVWAYPADVIYCEESNSMFEYQDGQYGYWDSVTDGQKVENQECVDFLWDQDVNYENCMRYAAGEAKCAYVSSEIIDETASASNPSVTFTFSGSGFELISAANNRSGLIKVVVENDEGTTIFNNFVDTYYGCAYNEETGEWTTTDNGGTVYQIPIARYDLTEYGTYTVTVTAIYSALFDHAAQGEFEFIVDGIRIYDPLGTGLSVDSYSIREALLADGTENTITYIDGNAAANPTDVEICGSANEIFLAKGQSVAFYATASSDVANLQIGARALEGTADGTAVKMNIYAVDPQGNFNAGISTPCQSWDINTATLMHYDMGISPDAWSVSEDMSCFQSKILVITNDGDGILALRDIRANTEYTIEVIYNDTVLAAAQKAVSTIQQRREAFKQLTDVDANAWYYNSVKFSVESGIMAGVGNNEFAPNQELTRAMAVRVLYVLAGKPETQAQHAFTDVAADAWYADAVAWGAANGIVAGVSTTSFAPDGKLTREQMVSFLYRFAARGQTVDNQLTAFTDCEQVSAYAVDAMNWAIANGIVSGMGNGTLAPKATANRAQMATILAGCDMLYAN